MDEYKYADKSGGGGDLGMWPLALSERTVWQR